MKTIHSLIVKVFPLIFLASSSVQAMQPTQPLYKRAYGKVVSLLADPQVRQGAKAAACLAAIPLSCYTINTLTQNEPGFGWLKTSIALTSISGSTMLASKMIKNDKPVEHPRTIASLLKMAVSGALLGTFGEIPQGRYGVNMAVALPYLAVPGMLLLGWGAKDISEDYFPTPDPITDNSNQSK